jgi:RsiW-degrading membrane proteinase PrsW (M82 family)
MMLMLNTQCGPGSITLTLHKPNLREKLFFLFSGMAISVPFTLFASFLAQSFIDKNLPEFIAIPLLIAIVAPLLEEFAKAYPLFYRHGETEKSVITLGFLTGLGFGIVEFFLYVFVLGAPILIRLPAAFFHATNTSIVAYGIIKKRTLTFYLIAVVLHFTINFSAFLQFTSYTIPLMAVLISFVLAGILYLKAKEKMIEY